jgi:hypothetical protein
MGELPISRAPGSLNILPHVFFKSKEIRGLAIVFWQILPQKQIDCDLENEALPPLLAAIAAPSSSAHG